MAGKMAQSSCYVDAGLVLERRHNHGGMQQLRSRLRHAQGVWNIAFGRLALRSRRGKEPGVAAMVYDIHKTRRFAVSGAPSNSLLSVVTGHNKPRLEPA